MLSLFRKILATAIVIAGITMLIPCASQAQPNLIFRRVVNNWPTIELYFILSCNGQPAYDYDKNNFRIEENGIEIDSFTYWCPDLRVRCAISVAMIFDAGQRMAGEGNTDAVQAGNTFVNHMDGLVDEAAVIWFSDEVDVRAGITTDTIDIETAIGSLPATGPSHVWDGVYAGIQELINAGNNPCRAVLAFTTGRDDGSTHTPEDIISLANRNRIEVYTFGFGNVDSTVLKSIAMQTKGQYITSPTTDQLAILYEEISTTIFGMGFDCLITYEATCMDGSERNVDMVLENYCNGTETKSKMFLAALVENIITRSGDDLYCEIDGVSYQWFLDSLEIPGATERTYKAEENGVYTVLVTDAEGCAILSQEETVVTGVGDLPTLVRNFTITPNPNNGSFQVALEFDTPEAFSIQVVNTAGALIKEITVAERVLSYRKKLDLHAMPAGTYILVLRSGDRSEFRRMIIQ